MLMNGNKVSSGTFHLKGTKSCRGVERVLLMICTYFQMVADHKLVQWMLETANYSKQRC